MSNTKKNRPQHLDNDRDFSNRPRLVKRGKRFNDNVSDYNIRNYNPDNDNDC